MTNVTTNASTGAGSLAQAIADAQDGDVVRFSDSVFERGVPIEIALASTLLIDKNLAIDGGPFRVRLTPVSQFRCVEISCAANVVFSGFDFVGGVATGNGGGILVNTQAKATFNRCRIVGCSASQNGGGVYVEDEGTAIINDSLIAVNKAASGGGVYCDGYGEFNGATIAGNVGENISGDSNADSASNSILCDYDYTRLARDVGNVVASESSVGFVAAPAGITAENWNWTNWTSFDFHLLDDAAENPSAYRDAGTLDADDLTRYDLDGNFRGRTAIVDGESVDTRSPGCFETIQADFFWMGKDSTGQTVESPSFANADGWAASRFADVSGSSVPTWRNKIFIGSSATFAGFGAPSPSRPINIVVSGHTSVSTNEAVLGDFSLGVGSYFGKTIYVRNGFFGDESKIYGVAFRTFAPVVFCGRNALVSYQNINSFSPIRDFKTDVLTIKPNQGTISLSGEYSAGMIIFIPQTTFNVVASEPVALRASSIRYDASGGDASLFTSDSAQIKAVLTGSNTFFSDYATSNVRADEIVVDLSETTTTATLNLKGQRVCGVCSGSASLTGSARVADALTASALALTNGANLALDGGFLGVATATLGAGSEIAGTGYYAFGATTGTGTIADTATACDYGAGVTEFNATATGPNAVTLTWTQTDATKTVLLQRKDGETWTTLDAEAIGGTATAELVASGISQFRVWDGAAFLVDAANFTAGAYFRAQLESSCAQIATEWETTTDMATTTDLGYRNETPIFMARIRNTLTASYLIPSQVESIKATVYDVVEGWRPTEDRWTPRQEWTNLSIPESVVLEEPIPNEAWDADEIGPNFIWIPDCSTSAIFPSAGVYVVQISMIVAGGSPIVLTFRKSIK